MAANLFAVAVLACLVMLTVTEILRFRRAADDPDGIPYPRLRLARRVGIAVLLGVIVLMAVVWPDEAPAGVRVGLMIGMLLLFLISIVLLLRDLHETSKAVVAKSDELSRRAARNLEQLLRSTQSPRPPEDANPPDRDDKAPPTGDSPASEE